MCHTERVTFKEHAPDAVDNETCAEGLRPSAIEPGRSLFGRSGGNGSIKLLPKPGNHCLGVTWAVGKCKQ